ncbi:Auxin-responsive protein [Melia azedarach]|uniref:Auxin-responsive protein n=1 Tax=Melia azedarach TaxID=155640 RepID=A0ACC1Y061_MELAZ|nr:Auxin-responsive protein [Melia azedarach]
MISPKKLIQMAKKWQKLAASKRKRISIPRTTGVADAESCSTSSVAQKGTFFHGVFSLFDTKRCSKRRRKGIADVLSYRSMFIIFVHPSRAKQSTISNLQLLKQITDFPFCNTML